MSSNKAVGYDDDGEAPLVDWDWASPAIQAYSTANDLYKVCDLTLLFFTLWSNANIDLEWVYLEERGVLETNDDSRVELNRFKPQIRFSVFMYIVKLLAEFFQARLELI